MRWTAGLAALALLGAACDRLSGARTPAASALAPAWRGGCFWQGPSGKIVDGRPGPEVLEWGYACAGTPPYPASAVNRGGLVYLDAYDPGTASGDVTILGDAPSSVPVVVAPRGGAGPSIPGSPVARVEPSATRMLALRDLDPNNSVGKLVLVDLPDARAPIVLDGAVRIANYEWLADGVLLYVGGYAHDRASPALSTGAIVYRDLASAAPAVLTTAASRFAFTMYRLSRDRRRVAWLEQLGAGGAGALRTSALPPDGSAADVASGVADFAYADDGTLLFLQPNTGATSAALRAVPPAGGAPRLVHGEVTSTAFAGDGVFFTTGYDVLRGSGSLWRVAAAGGTPELLSDSASPEVLAAPGAVAWADVSALAPLAGSLRAGPPGSASFAVRDSGVTLAGGLQLSPLSRFLVYTTGFAHLPSPSSPNPMPGLAAALKLVPVAGGAPVVLAEEAAAGAAFSPDEAVVAAVGREAGSAPGTAGGFRPAANAGQLVVASTATGAVLARPGAAVPPGGFRFGDGGALAFLDGWDDGLQRGALWLAAPADSPPARLDLGVSFFTPPRGGRVLYGVRGGLRGGLWLGGGP